MAHLSLELRVRYFVTDGYFQSIEDGVSDLDRRLHSSVHLLQNPVHGGNALSVPTCYQSEVQTRTLTEQMNAKFAIHTFGIMGCTSTVIAPFAQEPLTSVPRLPGSRVTFVETACRNEILMCGSRRFLNTASHR